MDTTPLESQIFDPDGHLIIPNRLEDLSRLWKALRSSLVESLTSFNHFEKVFSQSSQDFHSTLDLSDPSFISKLMQNLLSPQLDASQGSNQPVDDIIQAFSKGMETYETKLDQSYSQVKNIISDSVIPVGLARVDYIRELANYEKVCKETEEIVHEKRRKMADPVVYYNMKQQKKIRGKILVALKKLEASEKQAEDIAEKFNIRQQSLNGALAASMKIFREAIKGVFDNLIENIKRHNRIFQKFIKKELDGQENSKDLEPTHSIEQEHAYLEQKKHELKNEKNQKEHKDKFFETLNKFLEKKEEVSDQEIYDYIILVQGHSDAALAVFKKREKNIEGLKEYIEGLANECHELERVFQRLSKGWSYHISSAVLVKQIGSNADPLYEGFAVFASALIQFSSFINLKLSLLNGIIQDQKTCIRIFENAVFNSLYDITPVKDRHVNLKIQQEKLEAKIKEIQDSNKDDDRLPVLKEELTGMRNEVEERKEQLRLLTREVAKKITQAFEDYRKHETSKSLELSNIIKEIMTQKHLLFKSLGETLNKVQSSIKPSEAVNEEIVKAFKSDFLMSEYLPYIDQGSEKDAVVSGRLRPAPFQRRFEPPTDLLFGEDVDFSKEGSSSLNEEGEKLTKFGKSKKEKPLDDFACAVDHGIVRQGRMYVYPNAICFSTVKLLGDLAIRIPIEDVLKIEKRTISLVFDTALTVVTKRGEVKFLSFFYRDKAYNLIQSLLKIEQNSMLDKDDRESQLSESAGRPKFSTEHLLNSKSPSPTLDNNNDDQTDQELNRLENEIHREIRNVEKELNKSSMRKTEEEMIRRKQSLDVMEKRKLKIRQLHLGDDQFPVEVVKEEFDCSAIELFEAIFSDRQITYKGKGYDNAWMAAKLISGDSEIKATKWSPGVPLDDLYEERESLSVLKRTEKSHRGFTYTHAVRETGIFVPKTCPVEEKHVGYWLGADEFIIQNEVITSKVPMSDCFVVKNCFKVRDVAEGKCELVWRFGIHFLKNTVFKGRISKSSQEETVEFSKEIFMPLVREQVGVAIKERGTRPRKRTIPKETSRKVSVEQSQHEYVRSGGEIEVSFLEEEVKKTPERTKRTVNTSLPAEEEEEIHQRFVENREEVKREGSVEKISPEVEKRVKEEVAKYMRTAEKEKKQLLDNQKLMRNIILLLIALNGLMCVIFTIRG